MKKWLRYGSYLALAVGSLAFAILAGNSIADSAPSNRTSGGMIEERHTLSDGREVVCLSAYQKFDCFEPQNLGGRR